MFSILVNVKIIFFASKFILNFTIIKVLNLLDFSNTQEANYFLGQLSAELLLCSGIPLRSFSIETGPWFGIASAGASRS